LALTLSLPVMLLLGLALGMGRFSAPSPELVYTRASGTGSDLMLVDVGRRLETALTRQQGDNRSPTWSPDGGQLAFVSTRSGAAELFVTDAAGQHERAIPLAYAPNAVVWSPRGDYLAVRMFMNGSPKLAVLAVGGEESSWVVNLSGSADSKPMWTPDGDHLMYISYRDGNPRLYAVNIHCQTLARGCRYNEELIMPSIYLTGLPDWSADGEAFVFSSLTLDDSRIQQARVRCLERVERCVSDTNIIANTPDFDLAPVWSGDGRWLAFISGKTRLYLMDMQTLGLRALVSGAFNVTGLAWSADGTQIVYPADWGGTNALFLVEIASGAVQRLTRSGLPPNIDLVWRPGRETVVHQ